MKMAVFFDQPKNVMNKESSKNSKNDKASITKSTQGADLDSVDATFEKKDLSLKKINKQWRKLKREYISWYNEYRSSKKL